MDDKNSLFNHFGYNKFNLDHLDLTIVATTQDQIQLSTILKQNKKQLI
jgi:hypothetical protein